MIMDINNLINILGQVKDLKRSGWIKRNISLPESDADHMFSCAFMVLILAKNFDVDRNHCLELALTHDLSEIISGDPTPGEKTKEDKYNSELQAITEISQQLSMPELVDWFKEFEECSSKEAQLVRCIDKLETVMTSAYYDKENRSANKVYDEFSANALKQLEAMGNNFSAEFSRFIQQIKL